ncbi:hypothetical protein P691DRAFT_825444 [Macrolepiota fuliginosa MF-IS2]|uniref:Uncharacterized protein n=1 Tax=Macrolepiota fuliginosa MF-IS2 TaxID=1400762 RepID=A0A9P5XA93_9AGAR|nr:hypothetical protein P691DRAFT_825444 [Macrolepiota fuliginosa MF-IS2]
MDILLDQEISVVFVGALAFGLYFSTFLSCVRWLLFADEGWKVRRDIRWPTVAMTILIFGVNVVFLSWTLHWTMVKAWHATSNPGVPYQVPEWADIIWCTLPGCNVLLADITAIHRCWVVYGRRVSVIVVPVFLWFAALLCNVLQIYLQTAHIKNPRIGPYSWGSASMTMGIGVVLIPFWVSTILLNGYVSGELPETRGIILDLRLITTRHSCVDSTHLQDSQELQIYHVRRAPSLLHPGRFRVRNTLFFNHVCAFLVLVWDE